MRWGPAAILGSGVLLVLGVSDQAPMPLRTPLDAVVPAHIAGYAGRDVEISASERRVAGMSSYVMRRYGSADAPDRLAYTLYIGYYESQTQGRTIHSPKNCLPGAGWTPLVTTTAVVSTPSGEQRVNRTLLRKGEEEALVLYWYQGRGRTAWNEYRVKWDLLRDAAIRGRSEEALVRIIVPVTAGEDEAFSLAAGVAAEVMPAVDLALPAG
jgi:EpsI family protein